jgi:hypothetical protein
MVQRLLRATLVDGAAAPRRLALRDLPSADASGPGEGGGYRPVTSGPDEHHDLPTPRTTLAARYVRVLLTCRSCQQQRDADLQVLIDSGRGDVPLRSLRWKCARGNGQAGRVELLPASKAYRADRCARSCYARGAVTANEQDHSVVVPPRARHALPTMTPGRVDQRDDGTRGPVKTQRSTAGHPVRSGFKGHAMNAEQVA